MEGSFKMPVRTEKIWRKLRYLLVGIASLTALFFLWYLITFLFYCFPVGSKIADGVNKENLLALELGISESEVEKMLGPPLFKRAYPDNDLIYATPGFLGAGWEITVEIVDSKLFGVYVEKADLTVYYCNKNNCIGVVRHEEFDELREMNKWGRSKIKGE
jgi:hypothetical protein